MTNDEYSRLSKRAVKLAVATGFILLLSKLVAWYLTGSATLLSSLTDTSLDLLASALNFTVLIYALRPADEEHRFGHGKAEGVAALFQSGVILVAGVSVLYQSVKRLLNPQPLEKAEVALGIMCFSLLLTLALVTYQQKVYKKTASLLVKADRAHFVSDIYANIGAILALLLEYLGVPYADSIGGILVALLIIQAAKEVFSHSMESLLDHELPSKEVGKFKQILDAENLLGYHDIRTRRSGKNYFFQVHLEFEDQTQLIAAHEVADRIEDKVEQTWKNSECIVHMDPISAVNPEIIARRQKQEQN